MRRLMFFTILVLISFSLYSKTDVSKIVDKIDKLYRYNTTHSIVYMDIITPNWQRTLEMEMWTKGKDKALIKILSPAKEKGIKTLKNGNNLWNYLPKVDKVIKIPPSMMMSSWMGSDFTNDDLVKEFTFKEDYSFNLTGEDSLYFYIECLPHKDVPVVWSKVDLTVRKEDTIPVKTVFLDEKNKEIREIIYKDIRKVGKEKIPFVIEVIPKKKEGRKTVLRYKTLEINVPIKDNLFTLSGLRKAR